MSDPHQPPIRGNQTHPTGAGGGTDPEFLRIKAAVQRFGIGRTKLTGLIASNAIESRLVTARLRLIRTASLRAWIEAEGRR